MKINSGKDVIEIKEKVKSDMLKFFNKEIDVYVNKIISPSLIYEFCTDDPEEEVSIDDMSRCMSTTMIYHLIYRHFKDIPGELKEIFNRTG
jgi:hypothetical protein